jgi:hypothetical protein
MTSRRIPGQQLGSESSVRCNVGPNKPSKASNTRSPLLPWMATEDSRKGGLLECWTQKGPIMGCMRSTAAVLGRAAANGRTIEYPSSTCEGLPTALNTESCRTSGSHSVASHPSTPTHHTSESGEGTRAGGEVGRVVPRTGSGGSCDARVHRLYI